jgi:hypothetical protein
VTFDSQNNATFYLDGYFADLVFGSSPARLSSADVNIGANPQADDSGFYEYWNGSIDEAAIYPYVLSSDQVYNHYNVGTTGGPAPHHGSGPHAVITHDLNRFALTTLPPTTLGHDLGVVPSGQVQQIGPGLQLGTVDQLFRSLPAQAPGTSDARVSLTMPVQQLADPFILKSSLANDSLTL